MGVRFRNIIRVSKFISINVINDVRRLCFRGVLLPALFFQSDIFEKMTNFEKYIILMSVGFLL